MRIAAERVHQAGARTLQHEISDGRPCDEVRRPLDLRAASSQLAQALLEVSSGVALGVGDDRGHAPSRQRLDEH